MRQPIALCTFHDEFRKLLGQRKRKPMAAYRHWSFFSSFGLA